ncbi:hypothetical protein Y032_0001g275 [Ancylostoma ceylanicum]|uniref:Uncharacterized protein n=1 Tax=Ancylostoma ceylanicum TaxID=53326 RepID=A0A016W2T1_9BILA|nr:hypothetical protein Y032_0001g275 [Ancylostoma ceylanicum]
MEIPKLHGGLSMMTADQNGISDSVQNHQKPLFSIPVFGGAIGRSRGAGPSILPNNSLLGAQFLRKISFIESVPHALPTE